MWRMWDYFSVGNHLDIISANRYHFSATHVMASHEKFTFTNCTFTVQGTCKHSGVDWPSITAERRDAISSVK